MDCQKLRDKVKERETKMEELVKKAVIPEILSPSVKYKMGEFLLREAKELMRERMDSEVLTDEELEGLWPILVKHSNRVPPSLNINQEMWEKKVETPMRQCGLLLNGEGYLDYFFYQKAREELGERYKDLMTTQLFYKLLNGTDPMSKKMRRIRISTLLEYIHERNHMKIMRCLLDHHDPMGTGTLAEENLRDVLFCFPDFIAECNLAPAFRNQYFIAIVLRRFFFFLDPKKSGRVKIVDVLGSKLFQQIQRNGTQRDSGEDEDNIKAKVAMSIPWFTMKTAYRILNHFEALDFKSCKGMLSPEDFERYSLDLRTSSSLEKDMQSSPIGLTSTFISRMFATVPTYKGLLDFNSYVEFVLAYNEMEEPQSIEYFFRILDSGGNKGYLDEFDLHELYNKGIEKRLCLSTSQKKEFSSSNIIMEIFDIVRPVKKGQITIKDLVKCSKAHFIIKLLISTKGFENFEDDLAASWEKDPQFGKDRLQIIIPSEQEQQTTHPVPEGEKEVKKIESNFHQQA